MSFWEIFALLVTAPIWVPMALVGAALISVAVATIIALPIVIIAEALRK